MKINEKHLSSFATSTAAVDRDGYLNKRGEVNKSFQRRWFVLKGNLLFYYEKQGETEPIGVIILEGCSVELVENSDRYTFELAFLGSGARTYVLAADSQEEMEDWMKAIACSSHEYMRCAVKELSRQLEEFNMLTKVESNRTATGATSSPARDLAASTATSAITNAATTAITVDAVEKRDTTSLTGSNVPVALRAQDNSSVAAGQPTRLNPFDHLRDSEKFVDPFNDYVFPVPPLADACERLRGTAAARSFEEMHRDFGLYIRLKMKEHALDAKKASEC